MRTKEVREPLGPALLGFMMDYRAVMLLKGVDPEPLIDRARERSAECPERFGQYLWEETEAERLKAWKATGAQAPPPVKPWETKPDEWREAGWVIPE